MINWKKYGTMFGVITAAYIVVGHVFNVTGVIIDVIDSSERVKYLEKKLDVYDSLHNTYEWRKKRADRYYTKQDSVFKILEKKRIL